VVATIGHVIVFVQEDHTAGAYLAATGAFLENHCSGFGTSRHRIIY